jgi:hypothetical protein
MTPSRRASSAGVGQSERLLQRIRALVREIGEGRASGAPPRALARELERLRSQLVESVRRDMTDRDDVGEPELRERFQ